MSDSPLSATPYEILGVPATASTDELRRAHRRMLRETHPDTGGDPTRFHAVQHAWERIGTPEDRAAYDRGRSRSASDEPSRATWAARGPSAPRDTRPPARSHGHPGGWSRERYLALIREWAGRGVTVADPYDPSLVRTAPRGIRHLLANALAEESTARAVAELGIAFTIWHDVATNAGATLFGEPGTADDITAGKLDHIVLGPTGLFAVQSEDWGAPIAVRRGELVGEALVGERPMNLLSLRARAVARAARVKFTGLIIVVPDGAAPEALAVIGRTRGLPSVLVHRSRLPGLLRTGIAGVAPIGGNELFDVRTRLQSTVRFV